MSEWHRETDGIDYYACFTLKHQMRKYFYFGDLLEPAYRKQMFTGAKKWTAQDPMRRPHYAYQGQKEGWGPDAKNSWVDIRSTENLYLMRVTSVYLMAEETGNKDDRRALQETPARLHQDALPRRHRRVGFGKLPRPLDRAAAQPLRLREGPGGEAAPPRPASTSTRRPER